MGMGREWWPERCRPVTDDRPAAESGVSASTNDPPVSEPVPAVAPPATRSAEHLTITQARDLLDWLEGKGIAAQEVTLEADGTMTVRWAG